MHMPSPHRLKILIGEAMQARAPKMYARLKKAGALEAELADREEVVREAFETTLGRQDSPYQRALASQEPNLQKRVGAIGAARSAAAEQAIAIAIEFPEEEPASEELADPSQSLPRE